MNPFIATSSSFSFSPSSFSFFSEIFSTASSIFSLKFSRIFFYLLVGCPSTEVLSYDYSGLGKCSFKTCSIICLVSGSRPFFSESFMTSEKTKGYNATSDLLTFFNYSFISSIASFISFSNSYLWFFISYCIFIKCYFIFYFSSCVNGCDVTWTREKPFP